jgi:hypothetical protein
MPCQWGFSGDWEGIQRVVRGYSKGSERIFKGNRRILIGQVMVSPVPSPNLPATEVKFFIEVH